MVEAVQPVDHPRGSDREYGQSHHGHDWRGKVDLDGGMLEGADQQLGKEEEYDGEKAVPVSSSGRPRPGG